jgi:membrane associated rhomboid family serine protease
MGAGKDPVMFIPLHDDTPLKVIRFQFVTLSIIVGNVIIFLVTGAFQSDANLANVATSFGVVPADFTHAASQNIPFSPIPEPLTFITYMFLHAGWMHLISNMLFLWVFADNVEDAFGYFAFALFYLLCGIAGALAHVIMTPDSPAPLIGASGAVSGVIGAYVLLYPKARVWILLFFRIPLRISAIWVLGGWFLLQIFSVLTAEKNSEVEVAWWAHIGGFIAGLAITLVLRSRLLVRPAN